MNTSYIQNSVREYDFQELFALLGGSLYLEMKDDSSNEERFKAIGFSLKLNVLLVVYCYRDEDSIRVISARKATKKERKEYEKTKS